MTSNHEANVHATGLSTLLYGDTGVALDDPAETYHEASKFYPSFAGRQAAGVALLESEPTLQRIVARAVKRHAHRPAIALPAMELPDVSFAHTLRARRSTRVHGGSALTLAQVAALLQSGYGVTRACAQPLRSVPSGGALYPLELYLLVTRAGSLPAGLFHYDPLRHVLEELRRQELCGRLRAAMIFPELADGAAAFVAVTAMFWRSRFKYGLRGYRFALLEAGHVVQNLLLAATALELAAVPVGGFYDRVLEDLLEIDGVDESVLYGVSLSVPGEPS